jgi:rhodanese-related sulfurtransferase
MKKNIIALFFVICTLFNFSLFAQRKLINEQYRCMPCGVYCDEKLYTKPGTCSSCKMKLVKRSSVTFKYINAEEICAYIEKHPKVILIDVRTKEEFEGKTEPNFGSLKNAINIPFQVLKSKLKTISHLKNKEIIVYCSHSHRSPQAAYLLTQNGFTNVNNMTGGMNMLEENNSCKK